MEQVLPGADADDPFSDPIMESNVGFEGFEPSTNGFQVLFKGDRGNSTRLSTNFQPWPFAESHPAVPPRAQFRATGKRGEPFLWDKPLWAHLPS
jgi:hypothetical protein